MIKILIWFYNGKSPNGNILGNVLIKKCYVVFYLSRTEELAKASTCAHDRRALQQLALNVHVKHFDLTCCVFLLD